VYEGRSSGEADHCIHTSGYLARTASLPS
jgi:hypothetical protein